MPRAPRAPPAPRRDPAASNVMFYQRAAKISREAEFIVQSLPHAEIHAVVRMRRQLVSIKEILRRIQDPFNDADTNQAMQDCIDCLAARLIEFEVAPPPPRNAGVKRVRTGRPGQPAYDLNIDDIMFQRGIGARFIDIAKAMGVTSRTLRNHLRKAGIVSDALVMTAISDIHLDHIVSGFVYNHPFTGVTILKGFLGSIGIILSR